MTTIDLNSQRAVLSDIQLHKNRLSLRVDDTLVLEIQGADVKIENWPTDGRWLEVRQSTDEPGQPVFTRCPLELLSLKEPIYIRLDLRGQVELVSGNQVVLKMFASGARPEDWPVGLQHADVKMVSNDRVEALCLNRTACLVSIDGLQDLTQTGHFPSLACLATNAATELADLATINQSSTLRWLNLRNCGKVVELAPIAKLIGLESLELTRCTMLRDLTPLGTLRGLKTLVLTIESELTNFAPLAKLTQLESLRVYGCEGLRDLKPFGALTNLRTLRLFSCTNLADITPLAALTNLESLQLMGSQQLTDLTPLSKLVKLRDLDLTRCSILVDIEPISALSGLLRLDLGWCSELRDLTPLSQLTHLRRLDLWNCSQITHVSPIAACPNLETLNLSGCMALRDIDSLRGSISLRRLTFDRIALRDGVLLAGSTHRRDAELLPRTQTMIASFHLSDQPEAHAARLLDAINLLAERLPAAEHKLLSLQLNDVLQTYSNCTSMPVA